MSAPIRNATYHIADSIDPITSAPSLAKAMMSAQYTDLHWRLVFPSLTLPQITEGCTQRLPFNLISGRDLKRHVMAVDDESREAIGYSRWILPDGLEKDGFEWSWNAARVRDVSMEERMVIEKQYQLGTENGRVKGVSMDVMMAFGPKLEVAEEAIMKGPGPWLSLDYMTVHPEYQRRGIGSMLLEAGLKVANEKGWKTIVMSQPQGVRLYEKHGFVKVTTVDQDDSKFGGDGHHICVFMVKQPDSISS